MYKLVKNGMTDELLPYVVKIVDNLWIPTTSDNSDYQQYLDWIAAGNTPLPAGEV